MKSPTKSPKHWPQIEPALAKLPWSHQTMKSHRIAARFLDEYEPRTMTQAELMELRNHIVGKYKRNAATGYILRIKKVLKEAYGRVDLKMPAKGYGPSETLPPSVEDTARILAHLQKHYLASYVALVLGYESGLRPMEQAALDVSDVDLENGVILLRRGKTGMRTANLSPRGRDAIVNWLPRRKPAVGHEKALLLNSDGHRPNRYGMVRKAVQATTAFLGIRQRVYPNLFRAALASHALSAGTNPRVVQAHMGHKKLETTMIYNRVSDEDVRRGINRFWQQVQDRAPKPSMDARKEIGLALAEGRMSVQEAQTMLGLISQHGRADPEQPGGYG